LENTNSLKLNITDCMLGLYEKALPFSWDWDRKLRAVKELGYDFMEFSVDPAHIDRLDWNETEIAGLRDASFRQDVPLLTLAISANREWPLGSKDDGVRKAGKTLLIKAIILARKLGIRIVQIASYDVFGEPSDGETDRLFVESLHECERYAALHGVLLTLETMDTPYAGCIERCKRIIDEIGSPWIQIYADTGNIASAGINFESDLGTGAANVIAVHLKDSKPGICKRVDYGTGIVDFDADLQALKKIDFIGFFVAEMWADDDPAFLEKAGGACRFLREKIHNCGSR